MEDDMNQALRKLRATHGQPAVRAVLEAVAGIFAPSEVPAHLHAAVIAAANEAAKSPPPENDDEESREDDGDATGRFNRISRAAYENWNRPK